MNKPTAIPSVSVTYAQDGSSTKSNELGMRPMQEQVYQGFQRVQTADGTMLKIADLVDDDPNKRDKVAALKAPTQKNNRDHDMYPLMLNAEPLQQRSGTQCRLTIYLDNRRVNFDQLVFMAQ
ncbi:hypothetical protein XM38_035450 [Halomicronema hongdechloris C2206]|uniref:Uncharacterized protein n=1 Tax=Halomicronema hongdechloris C2206 TaxID=1641165 RepID=A0A1Z3HR24_9CYAN|nr:hypothetical protein [Halomicronema hongdechloris]ASC72587.1 hypothetical protein XM38_035450 [Halomicronema hongdechloris C2206]